MNQESLKTRPCCGVYVTPQIAQNTLIEQLKTAHGNACHKKTKPLYYHYLKYRFCKWRICDGNPPKDVQSGVVSLKSFRKKKKTIDEAWQNYIAPDLNPLNHQNANKIPRRH